MLYRLHFLTVLRFSFIMAAFSGATRLANDHHNAVNSVPIELLNENLIPFHNKQIMYGNDTKQLEDDAIYSEIYNKISSMLDDEEGSGLETDHPITLTTITSPTSPIPVTSPTLPITSAPVTFPTVPTPVTSPTLPTSSNPFISTTIPILATSTSKKPSSSPIRPTSLTVTTLASVSGSDCGLNRCEKKFNERCERRDGIHVCGCLRGYARRLDSPDRKCYAVEIVTVEMKFTKMEFKPEYEDIYSLEYNQLVRDVINKTMASITSSSLNSSFAVVTIKSIRRGSVIIDMELNFIQKPNNDLDVAIDITTLETDVETVLQLLSTSTEGIEMNITGKLNNCEDPRLNYCHENAICSSTTQIKCKCKEGFQDLSEDVDKPGETCSNPCITDYCFNGGRCKYDGQKQYCLCLKWFSGDRCQLDLRVVLSAIIAMVFLIIISCLLCIRMYCKAKKKNIEQLLENGNDVNPENDYFNDNQTFGLPNDFGFTEEDERHWLDIEEDVFRNDCISVLPGTSRMFGASPLPNIDTNSSSSSQSMGSHIHLRNKDQLFSRKIPRSCTFLPSETNFIHQTGLCKSLVPTQYSDSFSGDSFF